MLGPSLVIAALGLVVVPTPLWRGAIAPRSSQVVLSADPEDVKIQAAAQRVVLAAQQFGGSHGAAAAEWVEKAMEAGSKPDESELLEKQLALFEECLIEDSAKCKELDLALTALENKLEAASAVDAKTERAAARVRMAAAKFGVEQERIAALWVKEVIKDSQMNPFTLLEQQAALFSECLIDEDGGSARCQELDDALGALQASFGVRGMITPTNIMPKEE